VSVVGGRSERPGAWAFAELARTAARERRWGDHAIHRLARAPGLSDTAVVDAVLADPPPVAGRAHPDWPADFLTPPDAPTIDQLEEIDAEAARRVLGYLLTHDLAYSVAAAPPDRAGELAAAFISTLRTPTRWWTNNDGLSRTPPRLTGWTPLTRATFDSGVIGVDDRSVLIVWFMDED
jgi:hypothetical protein